MPAKSLVAVRLLLEIIGAVTVIVVTAGFVSDRFGGKDAKPRAPIESYVPGASSMRRSTDYALLGISDGMSVGDVAKLFPPGTKRRIRPDLEDPRRADYSWEWRDLSVSVEADVSTHAVTNPSVMVSGRHPAHVRLPRGLLLGRSTVRQVVSNYGQPEVASGITETDGAPQFYLLQFGYGAEGAFKLTYHVEATPDGSVPLPGQEITSAICDQVITGASFAPAGLTGGADWPAAGLCG